MIRFPIMRGTSYNILNTYDSSTFPYAKYIINLISIAPEDHEASQLSNRKNDLNNGLSKPHPNSIALQQIPIFGS